MNNVLSNYQINKQTLALLPAHHLDYQTIVLEGDRELYVKQMPLQLIEQACLEGGSTYEGRRKAVVYLTGAKNKVPIPISPWNKIYAFPTHSPQVFECSWIFHPHVRSVAPSPKDPLTTIITFLNGKELTLNVSSYTIQQQIQRTSSCILRFSNAFFETQCSESSYLINLPFKFQAKL